MNGFTFAPALGWLAASALATALAALAVGVVALHARRRGDETLGMCVRRVVICVLLAVLAFTPSVAATTTSRAVNATDVVIAADVTGSMGVGDATYGDRRDISRLDAAKAAIDDITTTYANSSFAAVSFGSAGTLDVPLTPDAAAIDHWAASLRPEATAASSGSSADAAIDQLLLTLKSIRDAHPDDRIVLYLITDGEQTIPTSRRTFSSLRRYLDDACVIGVGTESGGRVPKPEADGADGGWVVDPSTGQPGVSIMDRRQIESIADELSGTALFTEDGGTVASSAIARESQRWRSTTTYKERVRVTPVVWPVVFALLAVMAWEAGAWFGRSRRLLQ
ncbi:von Willebrand factor A [Bifidobacterium italicum]|uniref:von Willebrand factor A n=1 Tax=Bifidobacterium italicum TaxID=1960968 RepID=A0A2A2EKD9_9BIFI|nr:vWA domain-containing protein [Bifidobacterium italicum]PAU69410.1 von Willebrand factor A [Bifidobacterium italicum]